MHVLVNVHELVGGRVGALVLERDAHRERDVAFPTLQWKNLKLECNLLNLSRRVRHWLTSIAICEPSSNGASCHYLAEAKKLLGDLIMDGQSLKIEPPKSKLSSQTQM